MTKEDHEDFKNSIKCWICDNDYVDNDAKVKDHCHITGGCAHRERKTSLKLNHKISVVFHKLKHYDSHLTMQELDKFNLRIRIRKIYERHYQ